MLDPDPLWYKDAIIYELHVKAFLDSTGDGIGDFPGLIQKLDYLEDLGITCVWLLPFYPSPLKDDGYDISDYLNVHPAYGTLRDFRHFVREAHRRGIRVITELVVNHTSDQHPWFQASRKAPAGSIKRNYYVWSETDQRYRNARIIFTDFEKSNWTKDPEAGAFYWHRFFHHQPDLNYDNRHVRRAVLRYMRFWFDMGVDGMRLDAIPYLIERDGTNCENLPETHAVLKEWRRALDAEYEGRMFLAEANQWPDDVRPYFGEGDECHMAFHFPLMPRMFVAIRQEDRHPIVDILEQTPKIPDNCQWALFLRNHDELTLEMVTDEERDYMYKEYAADPQMRVNLGIRRRLAPLVENSRRRIELLNSLLFSLPGTPIIYYGDEIGMGDNIYLGDRNGVRTPMQWTGDRNAGFSRADFARLYAPPVMDPVYGYQAINVEAQQRDPASLLNWMKRLIALRKRFKAFGRGTLEFLHPANRKVLAYIRRGQGREAGDETIFLGVANLSRFVQPVELDLSEFRGLTPVEMFGRVEFPPIGELPYFLTLGPHSFYWFQLERAPEHILLRPSPPAEQAEAVPALTVTVPWERVFEAGTRARLEQEFLPAFLRRQRWFGAKARGIKRVRIVDWQAAAPPLLVCLALAEVRYADGAADTYFVPLSVTTGGGAQELLESHPQCIVARLRGPAGKAVLHDAIADDAACAVLLAAIQQARQVPMQHGVLRGARTSAAPPAEVEKPVPIARLSAEQSNSSITFGGKLILKVFRRVEPGPNPDYEIGRFLTERTRFDRVPRTAGAIEYERPGREAATLALLQDLVPNQGDAWQYALAELGRYFELAATAPHALDPAATDGRSLLALSESTPPTVLQEMAGPALHAARTLGRRTAELHLALASDDRDPAFRPEPVAEADLSAIGGSASLQAERALSTLQSALTHLPQDAAEQARRLLDRHSLLRERLTHLPPPERAGRKTRVHGDYHLGQVLWVENDFVILDFEGEPARPLAQRRAKYSPLKDVAGMLRSYNYAAYAGLLAFTETRPQDYERLAPWAALWRTWTSAAFLAEYRATAGDAAFLPAGPGDFAALLQFFILDKALYELLYELNNRPDWVRIPLLGILQLLEWPAEGSAARV